MAKNLKQIIFNRVSKLIAEGENNTNIFEVFLMLHMSDDLLEYRNVSLLPAESADIARGLTGNQAFAEKDIRPVGTPGKPSRMQKLKVYMTPAYAVVLEPYQGILYATVNDKRHTTMSLRGYKAQQIVEWLTQQKQKMDSYFLEWDNVLRAAYKKAKGNRLSMYAIEAIFKEEMSDYPNLKYDYIEQKRRVRIRVKIPNCNLGVFIDAYWGSYRQKLPTQIENLKQLLDLHSRVEKMNYFVSR